MAFLQTAGTSSCAMAAIGHIYKHDPKGEDNEKYLADPIEYRKNFKLEGMSVSQWYNDIIYPTQQDLGRTGAMPVSMILDDMEEEGIEDKFIICCLNGYPHNGYWGKKLKELGFTHAHSTDNKIGGMNYVYIRAPLSPKSIKSY